ncbi:MAG: HAD family hydrolase [Candidatus Hadarchaeales archaeon]
MEKIKAVLFDLDETLMDAQRASEIAHGKVIDRLMDFLTGRNDIFERRKIEMEIKKLEREKQIQRDYDRDRWWQELMRGLSLRPLEEWQLKELTAIYWDSYSEASTPFPDAMPLLDYLKKKGYRLGMVTDTDGTPGRKWNRIKDLSLMKYFDAFIIAGEETPLPKPDPEPFLIVASKLGVRPGECVVVGDKPHTDIRGGKNAGMKTIRVFRRRWHREEAADFTVYSLAEIINIL